MTNNLLDAPCIFCGYCSTGYYQSGTHDAGCPWRNIGALEERESKLRTVIRSYLVGVKDACQAALQWEKEAKERAEKAESKLTAAEAECERLRGALEEIVYKKGAEPFTIARKALAVLTAALHKEESDESAEANKLLGFWHKEAVKLRAVLEQVEWVGNPELGDTICPWCNMAKSYGHKPSCARQAALHADKESADTEWRPGLIGMEIYDIHLKRYRTVVEQKPDGRVKVKDGDEVGTWLVDGEYETTRVVDTDERPEGGEVRE